MNGPGHRISTFILFLLIFCLDRINFSLLDHKIIQPSVGLFIGMMISCAGKPSWNNLLAFSPDIDLNIAHRSFVTHSPLIPFFAYISQPYIHDVVLLSLLDGFIIGWCFHVVCDGFTAYRSKRVAYICFFSSLAFLLYILFSG